MAKELQQAQRTAFTTNFTAIKGSIKNSIETVKDRLYDRKAISDEVRTGSLECLICDLQSRINSGIYGNLFDTMCQVFDSIEGLGCLSKALRASVNEKLRYNHYQLYHHPQCESQVKDSGRATDSFLSSALQASESDHNVDVIAYGLQKGHCTYQQSSRVDDTIEKTTKRMLEHDRRRSEDIIKEENCFIKRKLKIAQDRTLSLTMEDQENTNMIQKLFARASLAGTKLEKAEVKIAQLELEKKQMICAEQRQSNQYKELFAQTKGLQMEVETLKSQLTDQEKQADDLKEQNQQLQEQHEELKKQNQQLQKQYEELKKQNQQLQKQYEVLGESKKQSQQLQESLNGMLKCIQQLQEHVEKFHQETLKFYKEFEQRVIAALEKLISQHLQEKLMKRNQQLQEELKKRNQQLREQRKELQKLNQQLRDQHNQGSNY